jgi:FkbM family methyltransferase
MMLNINEVISERYAWATQNRQTERLRALMRTGGCHVYAAGRYGRQVAAALRDGGYPVRGFIDAKASAGQEVEGTACRRPEDVDIAEASRAVLVIAINNFRTPVDDVCTWGEHLGFADVVFVPELPDLLGRHLGNYWQASRRDIFENAPAIARLDALLGDARSREILAQLVSYRISGRPEDHPTVDRERQYFPADLPLPTRDIAVIDCGAYPGDLLETALKAGKTLSHWYAFEPDPKNFGELCAFVNDRSDWVEEAVLFPCGVGDTVGTMCFATGDADASRAVIEATDSAETQILPIVRVDDVLKPGRLDMVKLDIEGFEAAALDGMAGLLDRYRPRLAMAVYHKPADLWELPFRVDKMMPGGRYALRQHGYNGYDTVLYVDWR